MKITPCVSLHFAAYSFNAAGVSLVNGSDYSTLQKKMLFRSVERGLQRRIAENELNLSSERILTELFDRIPNNVSWERFRFELKYLEKELLEKLDLSILMNSVDEWNRKYPFSIG